ncbi:hypothetical protein M9Y10_018638 [Tritrichomonas musculus]|uniref:Right handed beta helix domain-containing protein n=1 Tax=Tritrichomonas musculus TaxID=1915356 RepID=A0ABR2HNA3_9EUKA
MKNTAILIQILLIYVSLSNSQEPKLDVCSKQGEDCSRSNIQYYGDDSRYVINVPDKNRIFIISNCQFKSCKRKYTGGAIYIKSEQNTFFIEYCLFDNNKASEASAIYSNRNDITIFKCNFTNNFVYLEPPPTNTDDNYIINGNIVTINSSSKFANINISECIFGESTFYNEDGLNINKGILNGGIIYLNNTKATIENCTFRNNKFEIYKCQISEYLKINGGSLYVNNSDTEIVNCKFEENFIKADNYISEQDLQKTFLNGGVIYANRSSNFFCRNSTFVKNTFNQFPYSFNFKGGAIYINASNCEFFDCSLIENAEFYDLNYYTGIVYSCNSNSKFTRCNFADNSVDDADCFDSCNGGAVFLDSSDSEFEKCIFNNNLGIDGGALNSFNSNCLLKSCSFINNKAENSLDIHAEITDDSVELQIDSCIFEHKSDQSNILIRPPKSNFAFTNNKVEFGMNADAMYVFGDQSSGAIFRCKMERNCIIPYSKKAYLEPGCSIISNDDNSEIKFDKAFSQCSIWPLPPTPGQHTTHIQTSKISYYTQSLKFTASSVFTSSSKFTASSVFTSSSKFTASSVFTSSSKFTASSVFTSSSKFTASSVFTSSSKFTASSVFTSSSKFTESSVFTSSSKFTASSVFTSSSKFTASSVFTSSSKFTASSVFTSSSKFTASSVFTSSSKFTESSVFTSSSKFTASSVFTSSSKFTASSVFTSSTRISYFTQFTESTSPIIFSPSKEPTDVPASTRLPKPTVSPASAQLSDSEDLPASTGLPASTAVPASTIFPEPTALPASPQLSDPEGSPAPTLLPASTQLPQSTILPASTQPPGSTEPIHLTEITPLSQSSSMSQSSSHTKFTITNTFTESQTFTKDFDAIRGSHIFTPSCIFVPVQLAHTSSQKKLSKGAIIGISVGCFVATLLLILFTVAMCKMRNIWKTNEIYINETNTESSGEPVMGL